MERRKQNIIRRDSRRQLVTVLCVVLLGVAVVLTVGGTVMTMLNDSSSLRPTERAAVQQKHIRYRFRRIYNGSDVMTAPHAGAGPAMPTMSGSSRFSTGSGYSGTAFYGGGSPSAGLAVPMGSNHSAFSSAPQVSSAMGIQSSPILQSGKTMHSYSSGGGGSYGGGSTGGSGSTGITLGGNYGGVSMPALALWTPSTTSQASAEVIQQMENAERSIVDNASERSGPSAIRQRRRVSVIDPNDPDERGSIDLDDNPSVDATYISDGITYTYAAVDGVGNAWTYTADGVTYYWNGTTWTPVPSSIAADPDNPIGATPWLLLLTLAGIYAVSGKRKVRAES